MNGADCRPVGLGAVIARPAIAVPAALITVAQVVAVRFGWPAIPCVLHAATGIPCPGCGLSRAGAALLHGDVVAATRWNALWPLAVLVVSLVVAGAVLPATARTQLASAVSWAESRRGVSAAVLALVLGYWIFRLATGWRG